MSHRMRKHWRKLVMAGVISLLLLTIGGAVILRWASQPVEQNISIQPPSRPIEQSPQTVQTVYYSFRAPAAFRVHSSGDTNNPHILHTQVFSAGTTDQQIGVTTNLLPSDGLAGVADYNLRVRSSAHYQLISDLPLPAGSRGFRSLVAPGELTLFMVHGDRYSSVTVSGSGSSASLQPLFSTVYGSWQWL